MRRFNKESYSLLKKIMTKKYIKIEDSDIRIKSALIKAFDLSGKDKPTLKNRK